MVFSTFKRPNIVLPSSELRNGLDTPFLSPFDGGPDQFVADGFSGCDYTTILIRERCSCTCVATSGSKPLISMSKSQSSRYVITFLPSKTAPTPPLLHVCSFTSSACTPLRFLGRATARNGGECKVFIPLNARGIINYNLKSTPLSPGIVVYGLVASYHYSNLSTTNFVLMENAICVIFEMLHSKMACRVLDE